MRIVARERIKAGQIVCESGFAYRPGLEGQGHVVGVAKFDCLQGGALAVLEDHDAVMEALQGTMGRT